MELFFQMIVIAKLISIICRGFVFKARDVSWLNTILPFYNKVIIGDLSDNKKIGILTAVSSFLAFGSLTMYVLLLRHSLATSVFPEVIQSTGEIAYYLNLSKATVYILVCLLAAFVVFEIMYFICWIILMKKFSNVNDAQKLFALWIMAPAIAYILTAVDKKVYIPSTGLVINAVYRENVQT